MAWIRIGRFGDFKGADTLLIEADRAGFRLLIEEIQQLQDSVLPRRLGQHGDVKIRGNLTLLIEQVLNDRGLVGRDASHLTWQRSADGWSDIVAKLRVLESAGQPGHHYLNGPADELQVMAAIGEYGRAGGAPTRANRRLQPTARASP